MKTKLTWVIFTLVAAAFGQTPPVSPPPAVTRKDLLSIKLAGAQSLSRVEIKTITLGPGVRAGLHLHLCPVVGVVTAGGIIVQIEGSPKQHLSVGDAFYEPANARVFHFDNAASDASATFVAFYLVEGGDPELIRMLKKE